MVYVWSSQVVPTPAKPGQHYSNPTWDTANGQIFALIANVPTGYTQNGIDTYKINTVVLDEFGFTNTSAAVDTVTVPGGTLRYNIVEPGLDKTVAFYFKLDADNTTYDLIRDVITPGATPGTLVQSFSTIQAHIALSSNTLYTSYRSGGTGAGTYSVAWDNLQDNPQTGVVNFQIFNPDNSVASAIVSVAAVSDGTPVYQFRAGGGEYIYMNEQVVSSGTNTGRHFLHFQGYTTAGALDSAVVFNVQSPGASESTDITDAKFTQYSTGLNQYFIVYNEKNLGPGNTVIDNVVVLTRTPGQGVTDSHVYNIASGLDQKVRVSIDNTLGTVVVAYGDSASTTLREYDATGVELASITLAIPFNENDQPGRGTGLGSLDDGRYLVASQVDASQTTTSVTLDIVDFRTTGLSVNNAAVNNTAEKDYAGTQFVDTVVGANGFVDAFMGMAGNDTFTGGNNATNISIYQNDRANYFVHTANISGVLTTTVTQIGGTLADGTDTLKNVNELAFHPDSSPGSLQADPGHVFHLAGIDLNRVANFDGHAFDDVLMQVTSTSQLIFANMEAGSNAGFGALTGGIGTFRVVGHADINGDGIADVVVQDPNNDAVYAAEQNGSGNGAPTWVALTSGLKGGGFDFQAVGIGDVNGDGTPDVLLQNEGASGDGSILAVTGQSGGNPTFISVAPALKGGGVDFQVKGVGDINGDGFADVVLQDQGNATGQVLIRDLHDNSFFTLATNTGGLKVVGVGDVNGDGHADVVLQAAAGGNVYYLDPTGGLNDFKVVVANIGNTLIAHGVADVDNDGFADVLFQVTTNGEVDYRHVGATDADGFWGAVVGPNGNAFHLV